MHGGVSKDIWNKPFNIPQEDFDHIYNEALIKTSFAKDKIRILKNITSEAVENISDEELDCVYIDGDHTLRGITIDLITIYPKIKYGGYICGDDLMENPIHHGKDFEPTMIFPYVIYFAEAMKLEIDLLPHNQFVIYKKKNSSFKLNNFTNKYKNINLKNILFD
ncbi:class I SAM-dependent methyltransferase [Campylobacter volucris]|nr:class I SAM-dependent methyltransferase [Campylobacter volucris]